jgi:hypothetical protein
MKTFETFENEVLNWVTETDSKFDQDIFNILDPLEAQIETGEYTQEEIVDIVTQQAADQLGTEISTEEGARIEQKVEHFYSMLGLDSIPPDRRSRDYLDNRPTQTAPIVDEDRPIGDSGFKAAGFPGPVKGQPNVHSDDDFISFLRWLLKQVDQNDDPTFDAKTIVDVVERPDKYAKEYRQFLDHQQRVNDDPYL